MRSLQLRTAAALAGLFLALPAAARDINQVQTLSQPEFRLLAEDLGAAGSYKPLTPTAPLGTAGFDIGVAATTTRLQHPEVWDKASGGDFGSRLTVPSVRFNKGLPYGFDFGLMAATGASTEARLWGGEVRYALLKGNAALPAIGLRGSYTKITGVDQVDLDTRGADISISKGFLFVTPYAGWGRVWTEATPKGIATLSRESFSQPKAFVGVNFNFGIVNLAVETDRTGDARTWGAKVGWRF
jgi:hypothetical protein